MRWLLIIIAALVVAGCGLGEEKVASIERQCARECTNHEDSRVEYTMNNVGNRIGPKACLCVDFASIKGWPIQ